MASAALALPVVLVLGTGATQPAQAQTFTVLYTFTGGADGGNPQAGLFRDAAGNLYGTTADGAGTGCFGGGCGTVFKVDTKGTETVLHAFTGAADGGYSVAGLVRDNVGSLYGTTALGGSSGCTHDGCGVVFKVDTSGTETVLHTFAGGTEDGCYGGGRLLRDKTGNLYGVTFLCGASKLGTLFKVDTNGHETILHNFTGSEGAHPVWTGLVMDNRGNLYGVAQHGGIGYGTVYKLHKGGKVTVLHRFAGGTADGCYPVGIPIMDKHGNLYGTAEECGPQNFGVVWKLGQDGTETILHNFTGGSSDGVYPTAGVVMDQQGNLYGDTNQGGGTGCGGGYGCGTVYVLSKSGTFTVLHTFDGSDGIGLVGGLIRDANGILYGTASAGGSGSCQGDFGCGTVWKLTP